jgi:glucosyl-3-phosphoglycerate synthase
VTVSVCVTPGASAAATAGVVGALRAAGVAGEVVVAPAARGRDGLRHVLAGLGGDIVCVVDAGLPGCGAHVARTLAGALLGDRELAFVAAVHGDGAGAGGRVAALTARPLLRAFHPELGALREPLAREFAVRRALLARTAPGAGLALPIALALDAYAGGGLRRLGEVDVGARPHAVRPLEEEALTAADVVAELARRLRRDGRLRCA